MAFCKVQIQNVGNEYGIMKRFEVKLKLYLGREGLRWCLVSRVFCVLHLTVKEYEAGKEE